MEARLARVALGVAIVASFGARYKTPNFIVDAPTQEFAEQVGKAAEKYRRDLATYWLGKPLPGKWSEPCPISVKVGPRVPPAGKTSFQFARNEVYGWRMEVQGTEDRVLDSVLPHEVTHTIFASHFRQPLPRWADEGACTTVEHAAERSISERKLIEFLKTSRGIPFSQMFAMKEYPPDVIPLYAQGYSLVTFLIDQKGPQKLMDFLGDGMQKEDWASAIERHYDYANLGTLQNAWLDWVKAGRPLTGVLAKNSKQPAATPAATPPAEQVAESPKRSRPEPNLIYRAQSEDLADSGAAIPAATELVPVRREPRETNPPIQATQENLPQKSAVEVADLDTAVRQAPPQNWTSPPQTLPAVLNSLESQRQSSPAATTPPPRAPIEEPARRSGVVLMEWTRDAAGTRVSALRSPAAPLMDASLGGRGPIRR